MVQSLSMRPRGLKRLLRMEPFEPVRLGLSDGQSVLIRHPDQVVVSERYIYVGLTKLERSRPLATPRSGDATARDWLWVNLMHVTTIEPANTNTNTTRPKRRPLKG